MNVYTHIGLDDKAKAIGRLDVPGEGVESMCRESLAGVAGQVDLQVRRAALLSGFPPHFSPARPVISVNRHNVAGFEVKQVRTCGCTYLLTLASGPVRHVLCTLRSTVLRVRIEPGRNRRKNWRSNLCCLFGAATPRRQQHGGRHQQYQELGGGSYDVCHASFLGASRWADCSAVSLSILLFPPLSRPAAGHVKGGD